MERDFQMSYNIISRNNAFKSIQSDLTDLEGIIQVSDSYLTANGTSYMPTSKIPCRCYKNKLNIGCWRYRLVVTLRAMSENNMHVNSLCYVRHENATYTIRIRVTFKSLLYHMIEIESHYARAYRLVLYELSPSNTFTEGQVLNTHNPDQFPRLPSELRPAVH